MRLQTLVSIALGIVLGVAVLACVRRPLPSAPPKWDGKCLGRPGDAGRVVHWMGPPLEPGTTYGTRYVCKWHEQDGWWFEASPRERWLP